MQVPGSGSSLSDTVAASHLHSLLKAEGKLSFGLPTAFEGSPAEVILESLGDLDCSVDSSLLSGNCGPGWSHARYGSLQGQLQLIRHPASKHQLSLAGCGQFVLQPFFQDDGSKLTLHEITQYLMDALTVSEGVPDYICFQTSGTRGECSSASHAAAGYNNGQMQADILLQVVSRGPCWCQSGLSQDLFLVPTPQSQPLALGFLIPRQILERFTHFNRHLPSIVLDLDETLVCANPFPGLQVK